MTREEALKIVANEDYLPWAQVEEAKRVLGIKTETAAEIWATRHQSFDREGRPVVMTVPAKR